MSIDPIKLAQQNQAEVRATGTQRRVELQLEQDEAELPTFWQGWDPSQNRHTISRVGSQDQVTIATSVSSGGFLPGRRYDTAYSKGYVAIDTRPYIRRTPVTVTPDVVEIGGQLALLMPMIYISQPTPDFFQLDKIQVWLKLSDKPILKLYEQTEDLYLSDPEDGLFGYRNFIFSHSLTPIKKDEWVAGIAKSAEYDSRFGGDYLVFHYKNGSVTTYQGSVSEIDFFTIEITIPDTLRPYVPWVTDDTNGAINDLGQGVPQVYLDAIAATGLFDYVGSNTFYDFRPFLDVTPFKANWYYPNDRINTTRIPELGEFFSTRERFIFKNNILVQGSQLSDFFLTPADLFAINGWTLESQWGNTQYWPPQGTLNDFLTDPTLPNDPYNIWIFSGGEFDPVSRIGFTNFKVVPLS